MKKTILQFTFIALAVSMVFISSVSAATINAISCSRAHVQEAINSAITGDKIAVPAGSCTWEADLAIPSNKKIILHGSGKTLTLITGRRITMETSGSRVTGFGFSGTTITVDGDGWRIDNNNFTYTTRTVAIQVTGYRGTSHPTGLVDNNIFTQGAVIVFGFPDTGKGMANAAAIWALPTDLGTGTNVVYIENNTFTSGASNVYYSDCMDANYGGRFVFRYNTLYNTHTEHHGIQSTSNRGNPRWEIYNNSYTTTLARYNAILGRGGTGVIFGNKISGPYTLNINIDSQTSTRYGDFSCTHTAPSYSYLNGLPCDGNNPRDGNRAGMEGYPCRDQIGRGQDIPQWAVGQSYAQSLFPLYSWNNMKNGRDVSAPTISREASFGGCTPSNAARHLVHLKANRDFYYSTAIQTSKGNPFNGASGVGYGLLAYRPDRCDPLPVATGVSNEQGGGVAYWATDTNTLYRCSAKDNWMVHYKPYTYPHPLASPELQP